MKIFPSNITGSITAPSSKSSMQRACAAALIKKGHTIIENPGNSNDDIASLNVVKAAGATVETLPNGSLSIDSSSVKTLDNLAVHFGESGLAIRMFTPILATLSNNITIQGEGSLSKRPMHFFDEILPKLGIQVQSNEGHLPLQLSGKLLPQDIHIDGSLSSQFLTGLLFAFAASKPASTKNIYVNNLKSKPYIDLTLKVMEAFNLPLPTHDNYQKFCFTASTPPLACTTHYTVEGDWSGGAFLLVAGAVAGEITVNNLSPFSTQADKKILEALSDFGAFVSIKENSISVKKNNNHPFYFDATDCPDLFPPLVALAANAKGQSVIKGVSRLTHKESNRGITLQKEFAKLNVNIILQNDEMIVQGGNNIKGNTVQSHNDHRIAMACAIAALNADTPITIENSDAINKSYPAFYKDLYSISTKNN